jgi:hypothetical protein
VIEPADTSDLVHQLAVYSSDQEFLEVAVPFVDGALVRGEPVLVSTTAANLELLHTAMGVRADGVDQAETAYFGRRPPQRATALIRYWQRNARSAANRNVRVLAEPFWVGRSASEVLEWRRLESSLNVVLADTNLWIVCPYDTRTASEEVVAHALRTHPALVRGNEVSASPDYVAPEEYVRCCDALPLDPVPEHAEELVVTEDLGKLRRFVLDHATAHGLPEDRSAMLTIAVGEVITFMLKQGPVTAVARMWSAAGTVHCELHDAAGPPVNPFLGYRPPEAAPDIGDGLWLTHQICESVHVRSGADGLTVRLGVPGRTAGEAVRSGELV